MILNILTRILDPNKELNSKVVRSKKGWNVTTHPTSANGNKAASSDPSSMQAIAGECLFDSTFLSCLLEILKTSNPDLQRKVAVILEFIMVIEPYLEKLIPTKIEFGLEAVFQQKSFTEIEHRTEGEKREMHNLELEEAGLAVSAASRLLIKLLEYEQFRSTVDSKHFTKLRRAILASSVPLQNKYWIAACLVKLSSLYSHNPDFENQVNLEVALYETIPRLIQQIKTSSSPEVQEAAVLELHRIISEQIVESPRAIASEGGIVPLVKLMENGTDQAVEASLAILYNLSTDIENENHAAIIAAGTVPLLRKLVLSQGPQWMRALRLLRTLPK